LEEVRVSMNNWESLEQEGDELREQVEAID
jgi:hypothetical protein